MWDSIGHQYKTQATSSTAIFIPFPYSALAATAAAVAAADAVATHGLLLLLQPHP